MGRLRLIAYTSKGFIRIVGRLKRVFFPYQLVTILNRFLNLAILSAIPRNLCAEIALPHLATWITIDSYESDNAPSLRDVEFVRVITHPSAPDRANNAYN